jgi:hypothetical protein
VRVKGLNIWPHVAKLVWLRVRLILIGLLTLDLRVTGPEMAGAHLKGSETPLAENVMVSGFIIQTALGAVIEAKLTAAYAPAIRRLIERPTSRCGRYRLIGDDNRNLVRYFYGFKSWPCKNQNSNSFGIPEISCSLFFPRRVQVSRNVAISLEG